MNDTGRRGRARRWLSLRGAVRTTAIRIGLQQACSCSCSSRSVLGFFAFLWLLPTEEVELDRNADGIVVLTGGTSRVTDALELLAAGRGKRLLITGVNPGTTTADIARQTAGYDKLLSCCVDLDYSALNTLGNAVETRRWAIDRGFHSLIIVTSAYHMPRALAEISHQLPDVTLIPFPVVSDRLRLEPWWSNGATTDWSCRSISNTCTPRCACALTAPTAEADSVRLAGLRPHNPRLSNSGIPVSSSDPHSSRVRCFSTRCSTSTSPCA